MDMWSWLFANPYENDVPYGTAANAGPPAPLEPYGPPALAQPYGPPMPQNLGAVLEPPKAPAASAAAAPPQDSDWQNRLAGALRGVRAPPPPDVVKPGTPPPPRPHSLNSDLVRVLLAQAQGGEGRNPSVPLALGRVLGGR